MTCLIVFSHLRWDFVYQRPQQLMSRLAEHYRVLFVEEPVRGDGPPRLDVMARGPTLEVLVPRTPLDAPGFHDDQLALLRGLIDEQLRRLGGERLVAWFYTPMALPLLPPNAAAIVYDCMDELGAFAHAPPQLRQREAELLDRADVVLTGGPALFELKRERHPNVHCLPSWVDARHFAPARLDWASALGREANALLQHVKRPRLGFFGVIDERCDLALLEMLADQRPNWGLVMVGPVAKIDPAGLPQRPNLHWLGMRPYALLPYLLALWDVCLMPFALNDATRFISPTETLEYMAGEKPIVSTPIHDVIALYGDTVRVASAGPAFVAACERALAENGMPRNRRIGEMLGTVHRSSWEHGAQTVHELIEAALARPPAAIPPLLAA